MVGGEHFSFKVRARKRKRERVRERWKKGDEELESL